MGWTVGSLCYYPLWTCTLMNCFAEHFLVTEKDIKKRALKFQLKCCEKHEKHFACVQGAVCANPCPTGTYHLDCRSSSSSSSSLSSPSSSSLLSSSTLSCTACWFEIALRERCDCYNGAHCDHVNGQCHCLPGYKGEKVNNHQTAN